MDDIALIAEVLAGDRNAFRVVVVRYQRPIFRFLGTFRLSPAEREELAQETFVRAYQNLSSYDPARAAFSSWLFIIAKNLAMNEVARAGHAREQAFGTVPDNVPLVSSAGSPPGAHAQLESAERRSLFTRALSGLPTAFKNALVFAYIEELSLEDIATIESCSVGTVKSRIFRAKQLLRELLAQWDS